MGRRKESLQNLRAMIQRERQSRAQRASRTKHDDDDDLDVLDRIFEEQEDEDRAAAQSSPEHGDVASAVDAAGGEGTAGRMGRRSITPTLYGVVRARGPLAQRAQCAREAVAAMPEAERERQLRAKQQKTRKHLRGGTAGARASLTKPRVVGSSL